MVPFLSSRHFYPTAVWKGYHPYLPLPPATPSPPPPIAQSRPGVSRPGVSRIRNWLLWFSCALEEFWAVVAQLADWHTNSSPPWDSYRALISCRIIAIDKRPGVHPVGIGETLMRDFDKLVFRAAGDQAKVSYIGSGY